MGGGDLNLKKSWHPSTLRNIERVWKAEQKHEVEKQKIEQLQKELAEERAREEIQAFAEEKGVVKKKDERVDWMYQGPAAMVNRDEYLLGRKIDKTLETLKQMEDGGEASREDDTEIAVTMFSSQNLSGTATVDLARKIREDPLFSIMKKEKEERKSLLTNPVKMKQLQQLLKESLSKKKKSKKSKKKKHQESDSDEGKQEKKRKKHKKSSSSDSEDERMPSRESWKDHNSKHKINDKERFSSERRSFKHEYNAFDSYERRNKNSNFSSDERDRSHRSSHHKNSHSQEFHSRESNYESHHSDRSYRNHHSKPYDSKTYNQRDENSSKADKKRKLDSAEKERLLQEMQQNAKWREDQRKRNAQRYKEEEEREEKAHKVDTSDFLKPMLSKAVGKGSLENRVKQKIFTLQRSSADMDKHFARRD